MAVVANGQPLHGEVESQLATTAMMEELLTVQPDSLSFQFLRHYLLLNSPTIFCTSCFKCSLKHLILSYDPITRLKWPSITIINYNDL